MEKRYKKIITSIDYSLFDVKAWYLGELEELRKAIGFGFENTIFVSEDNVVSVYYDKEESEKFDEVLDKILTERFFNELCDDFTIIVEKFKPVTDEEIFTFLVKVWPAFVIFEEISNYPEYTNDDMLRRLYRIRETTESYAYKITENVKTEHFPRDYIFFKGKIYTIPFEQFTKENNIIIEND